MERIKVVCVEPRYQINLGYIARILKNFGFKELYLINPRCNYRGKQAIKYSKHAHELLENAKVYNNIKRVSKNSFLIGTTGIWKKSSASFYNVYDLEEINELAKRNLKEKKNVVILLGRDDTGLNADELRSCDACLFIGANRDYPVLNISHALSIILYEMTKKKYESDYSLKSLYADPRYQKRLTGLFYNMVQKNQNIRDKNSVLMAFSHVLGRAVPTKKEINAIAIGLSNKTKKKR